MSLVSALTWLAVLFLLAAIVLLIYIAVSKRCISLQRVWEFALDGHKPSIAYMALAIAAFVFAVAAQLLRIVELRSLRAVAAPGPIFTLPHKGQSTKWPSFPEAEQQSQCVVHHAGRREADA